MKTNMSICVDMGLNLIMQQHTAVLIGEVGTICWSSERHAFNMLIQ